MDYLPTYHSWNLHTITTYGSVPSAYPHTFRSPRFDSSADRSHNGCSDRSEEVNSSVRIPLPSSWRLFPPSRTVVTPHGRPLVWGSNWSRYRLCQQSVRIDQINGIIQHVSKQIYPSFQANRIGGDVSSGLGVVVAEVIVMESCFWVVVLARIYSDTSPPKRASFLHLLDSVFKERK